RHAFHSQAPQRSRRCSQARRSRSSLALAARSKKACTAARMLGSRPSQFAATYLRGSLDRASSAQRVTVWCIAAWVLGPEGIWLIIFILLAAGEPLLPATIIIA